MKIAKKYQVYNQKVYDLGKSYEIHLQDTYTSYLTQGKEIRKMKPKTFESEEEEQAYELEKLNKRKAYYHEKARDIRRTVELNRTFDKRTKFLTLTYSPEYDFKIENLKESNKEFKKFIGRLNYYLNKNQKDNKKRTIKYIATHEIQDGKRNKSGVGTNRLHYHVILFNCPFISNEKIASLWNMGFIKINSLRNVEDRFIAIYCSKYLTKDIENKANYSKAILSSKNLKRPEPYRVYYDTGFKKNETADLKKLGKFMYDKECSVFKTFDYRKNLSDKVKGNEHIKTKLVLYIDKPEYDKFIEDNNLKVGHHKSLPSYVEKNRLE